LNLLLRNLPHVYSGKTSGLPPTRSRSGALNPIPTGFEIVFTPTGREIAAHATPALF
jgi:hypothetical protein